MTWREIFRRRIWRHTPGCLDASRPVIAECLPGCGYVLAPWRGRVAVLACRWTRWLR